MRTTLLILLALTVLATTPGCGSETATPEPVTTVPEPTGREEDESDAIRLEGFVRVPRVVGRTRSAAAAQLRALSLDVRFVGAGDRVEAQTPKPGTRVRRGAVVRLTT